MLFYTYPSVCKLKQIALCPNAQLSVNHDIKYTLSPGPARCNITSALGGPELIVKKSNLKKSIILFVSCEQVVKCPSRMATHESSCFRRSYTYLLTYDFLTSFI